MNTKYKHQHFKELLDRTAPLTQDLETQLHVVRTNIKDVLAHNWEQVFASQLACVLHQFSHEFEYGLMASGAIMTSPDVAWGSSPPDFCQPPQELLSPQK